MRVRGKAIDTVAKALPPLVLPAAAAVLACAWQLAVAAPPALANGTASGVLYKLEFSGEGSVHVADSDGSGYSLDQNATWELKPETTEIWLPRVSEPPGAGNEMKTEAIAPEHLNPSGEVKETGTYAEEGGPASFSCSGPTNNVTAMVDTAEVGTATTSVTLTGDFFGTFLAGTAGSFGNRTGEFGNPDAVGSCSTDPEIGYETQSGTFYYFWDPHEPEGEDNTRMEVGAVIPPEDIGASKFGIVVDDYSNVRNSLSCEYNAPGSGCTLEFHLKGSWDLSKVCEGTVSTGGGSGSGAQGGSAGACASPSKAVEEKKPAKEQSKGAGKGKGGKEKGGKGKGGSGKSGGSGKAPKLSLESAAAKGAGAAVKLKCAGAEKSACKGEVTLSEGKEAALASKAVSLDAGKSKSLTVELDKQGRALLARAHRLVVELDVSQVLSGKSKSIADRRLTLTSGRG